MISEILLDQRCIIQGDHFVDYREFNKMVNVLSAYIMHQGWSEKKIACVLKSGIEFSVIAMACYKTRCCFVPIHSHISEHEVKNILDSYQIDILFVCAEKINTFKKDTFTFFKNLSICVVGCSDDYTTLQSIFAGDFNDLTTLHENHMFDCSLPAAILSTSGSTDQPKGVMHTFLSLNENIKKWQHVLKINQNDCLLIAEGYLLVLAGLFSQATIIFLEDFSPNNFLLMCEKYSITAICFLIPYFFQLTKLLSQIDAKKILPQLKSAITGGDAIPEILSRKFYKLTGVPLTACYGLTELPLIMSNEIDNENKAGFLGSPFSHVEIKLDHLQEFKGNVGELMCRSSAMFMGYYQHGVLTSNCFDQGWFRTGDIVSLNKNGQYFLIDRVKNIIICGGYNIYPKEVELALYQLAEIESVCVVGAHDEELGHIPIAYVVLKNNRSALTTQDLLRFLQTRLLSYKIPKQIFFVDTIPLNHAGKFDRKLLKN
ncbi:MAG TPA: class I adenylate-forming enzyme family protein [Coxiellaceae bacterium]|nr:MAG: hypothetical protein A3E81_07750 [Gammaproteobacteria bacterium RIFCSPHIGHO2_12_FULL_36_30]HLB57051.1 class I adenylate-forming enzyme family protein [Coxiellaceae bacterium]